MADDGFVNKVKIVADDSSFMATLKSMERRLDEFAKRAASLKIGLNMSSGFGNIRDSRSRLVGGSGVSSVGSGILVGEERRAAKAASSLAIALDSCKRSVELFNGKISKSRITGNSGNGGGPGAMGKFGNFAMMFPGLMQMGSMVASPIKMAIETGFSTFQSNEKLQTDLGTLLGNDQKGAEFAGRIRDYASATPYSQGDLAGTSKMLIQYGASTEETEKYIKQLGDISLGSSESMKSLGLVLGQVRSQGKLAGQDLMQFINAGFNPLSVISEKTGKSMSDLRDMMSKGQISFDMVAMAMESATSEGGKFYKGAERGSKTLSGLISTLKDNFSQAMASGIEKNIGKIKDILGKLVNFNWGPTIDAISSLTSGLSWLAGVAVSAVNGLNSISDVIGGANAALLAIGTTAGIATAAFIATNSAMLKMIPSILGMNSGVTGLGGSIKSIIGSGAKGGLFGILAAEIIILGNAIVKTISQLGKQKERENSQVESDWNETQLRSNRKSWQEAKKSAGDAYGKNEYATRSVDEAFAKYKDSADKLLSTKYADGVSHFGLTPEMKKELGIKDSENASQGSDQSGIDFDWQKELAKAMKNGGVKFTQNNTTNQTNNISSDFNDIGKLIGEKLDMILVSRLNFRTNAEMAKAATL